MHAGTDQYNGNCTAGCKRTVNGKIGKSKSLYVIYTPSAISPQTSPCAKAPGMERKRAIGSKDISIVIEKPLIKNIFYSAAMAV